MNDKNLSAISTFAEYMICPKSLEYHFDDQEDISKIGKYNFLEYEFRHISKKYLGNSIDSTSELLEEIKKSLVRNLKNSEKNKEILLLLSDGKDSMGLAFALSQLKIRCRTLTFLRKKDVSLRNFIHNAAVNLGHTPYFIYADDIYNSYDLDYFLKACRGMETPVLDQGFLYFLFGCKAFFEKMELDPSIFLLVDGLGNDEHFGYLPSKNQLLSFNLSKYGLWKYAPRKKWPFLRWYLRSPSEANGDLSALAAFFPFGNSYDINSYFSDIKKYDDESRFIDFRAFSRGAFHDHQCMMGKTIATAKALGCEVVFPWADNDLAEYCFNLPLSSKFDFQKLKNKLLLRQLLEESIDWNQEKRGVDLYFDLDVEGFKSILKKIIPLHIIKEIEKSIFMSDDIKKRAYLELLNFFGYCKSREMSEDEIESILFGFDK